MSLFKITPLEKKSISFKAEMYRINEDKSVSWFTVNDGYRWGQGWLEEEIDLPYKEDTVVYCNIDTGWGTDLDDQCSCWFDYSDDITPEEREQIEHCYVYGDDNDDGRCGMGWLFEGDHNWVEEDTEIEILGPFRVDRCDDNGNVVEENIELKPRPDPSTVWPFTPT